MGFFSQLLLEPLPEASAKHSRTPFLTFSKAATARVLSTFVASQLLDRCGEQMKTKAHGLSHLKNGTARFGHRVKFWVAFGCVPGRSGLARLCSVAYKQEARIFVIKRGERLNPSLCLLVSQTTTRLGRTERPCKHIAAIPFPPSTTHSV
jgi:hypothetical protein